MGAVIIGNLRHRVTLQQLAAGQDALGQPVQTWSAVATSIAADVRYLSGLATIRSGADASLTKASVRLRYRTGINAGMRVLHGTTVLDIRAVLPAPRKDYLDLVCEVVNGQT